MYPLLLALGLALAAPSAPPDEAAPLTEVSEARVRLMPPGAPNTGAFLTLDNPGAATALVSASVPDGLCAKVELHTHVEVDGAMRMRRVDRIDVPAGGTVQLKPGGLHVMLIGLTRPLVADEVVPITLRFADGTQRTVDAPVQRIQPPSGMRHE